MNAPPPPFERPDAVRRRVVATAGLLWAAGAVSAADSRHGVGAYDLDWRDAARGRDVPVRLYRPAQDRWGGAARPLVLYSHGFGGDRRDAVWLGPALAASGIACAHVQHVGSDRLSWLMGPVDWALRELRGDLRQERLARTLDLRFVLDRLLAGEAGLNVDGGRIAALGHSLGAQTALLLGGARLAGHGALRDERIGAVAAVGVAAFAGEDTAAVLRTLAVPSLHVTTEEDKTWAPGYAASVDDRVMWFRRAGGAARVLAVFARGTHALFNDADASDPVAGAAGELVQRFLEGCWSGDLRSLAAWRSRHAALVSRFELIRSPGSPG